MLSKDRLLEALLDPTRRAAGRARADLVAEVLRGARDLFEASGVMALVAEGRGATSFTLGPGAEEPIGATRPAAVTEMTRLLRYGRVVLSADAGNDPRVDDSEVCPGIVAGPALFAPLRLGEMEPGFLAAYRERGAAAFSSSDARNALLLAAWLGQVIDSQRLSERLEKLAVTDDLTQVYNYRFLKTALRRELRRAARYRQDLSIIMVDVDHLKAYNDKHGHLRGSSVLRETARLLATQVRSWDLVAKYGGDEFTVILPQTTEEGARIVAERLRAAVEENAFPLAAAGEITVSLGLASYPADGVSPNQLIAASDRALYRAKRGGRNRVEGSLRAAA